MPFSYVTEWCVFIGSVILDFSRKTEVNVWKITAVKGVQHVYFEIRTVQSTLHY